MHAIPRRTRAVSSSLLGAIGLFGALALSACAKSDPAPETPVSEYTVHVYTVRGEVDSLESPTTDFRVHHEAIPEFIGPAGTITGMGPMIMAFWPPQGLSLEQARVTSLDLSDVAPGDKVTLTFEVIHDPDTHAIKGYYATAVEKLPADTALDFSPLEHVGAGTE